MAAVDSIRSGFGTGLRAELERRAHEEQSLAAFPERDEPQPVSPELVLVCPELRAVELTRLA
jgi:hypothetical protein